jgi:microcompartment protein CcmL/EutN
MERTLQAVGMVELNSIAAGIETADYMVKAAQVEVLFMKTICPGKYVVAVHGEVASVQSSVSTGMEQSGEAVVDHFVIPNINPAVIQAMSCSTLADARGAAVGVIETFSAASAVVAADVASKTADVDVVEVRIAMGLGGKAFCVLAGDVAAVEMAVSSGASAMAESGLLVRKVVIPSAAPEVLANIM